ncbi:MAG: hypothetical protein IPG88_21690 [Gemmatimonadetes bacterium]|nr:hypothetical protein [Gemmatimonadota bacterium]
MAFLFGPVIASVLLVVASWPWIFSLNLPIAVVVFVMGRRRLPRRGRSRRSHPSTMPGSPSLP